VFVNGVPLNKSHLTSMSASIIYYEKSHVMLIKPRFI